MKTPPKAPTHGPFAAKMPAGMWQPMLNGVAVGELCRTRKEAMEAAERAQREADEDQ